MKITDLEYQIEKMTLQEKIGQLFVSGFPGTEPSKEFIDMVRKQKLGNVILFSHNIQNRMQLTKLNHTLRELIEQETGILPFISIDEEGGVVSRLPKDCAVMPSAMAQAELGDYERIYQGAVITAKELKATGINFNLAPVLDINTNPQNPVIGVRSYGETPEMVSRAAKNVVKAYRDERMLCSGKHFPGHGDVTTDSHLGLPVLDVSETVLKERELIPFMDMIKEGIPCLTIAHMLVPALESEKIPCTMSKSVVTGFLRNTLGFKGMIISDCMEMNAVKEYYGVEKGVVGALAAGIDLIFISHTAELVETSIQEIYRALADGRLVEEQIDQAVRHILETKEKYLKKMSLKNQMEVERKVDPKRFAEEFLEDTISAKLEKKGFDMGSKPFFIGIQNTHTTQVSDGEMCDFAQVLCAKYGGNAMTLSPDPSDEECQKVRIQMRGKSLLMVGTLNGHLKEGQKRLLKMMEEFEGTVIHVALRNPYDLKWSNEKFCKIALYEYSERSLDALMKIIDNMQNGSAA